MARLFDDASTEYLDTTTVPLSSQPATFACWFQTDQATQEQVLISLRHATSAAVYAWNLRVNATDNQIRGLIQGSGTADMKPSNTISANTWHSAVMIDTSSTVHRTVLDGDWDNSATSTLTANPGGGDEIDSYQIGVTKYNNSLFFPLSGRVAEVAIWSAALTQAEVEAYAAGFSPLLIRPGSLAAYSPLWRDEDNDHITGVSFTPVNTPSVATHSPNIYPSVLGASITGAAAAIATEFPGLRNRKCFGSTAPRNRWCLG